MKLTQRILLLFTMITLGTFAHAQNCFAQFATQNGSSTGEKIFVDYSQNMTSITVNAPGAIPSSVTFAPGTSASVVFSTGGLQSIQYIASNSITGCVDTVTTNISVCLITPPIVTLGTNPGEFSVTDPAIDSSGEYGESFFNVQGALSSTVSGSSSMYYPVNSTVLTTNSNGPHQFWYHTNSGASGCYDSILVPFNMTTVTACQANLGVFPMTWGTPGTYYLLDQSANNSTGVFTCPGATPSSLIIAPWTGVNNDTIAFSVNGSYPYSYVTYDSISGCTDSIYGVINVTQLATPCVLQAGLTVAPGGSSGQFIFTDNSIGSPLASNFEPGGGLPMITIAPNPSATVTYPTNGTYNYVYTVYNTNGTCPDTIFGTIVVSGLPTPCSIQANLVIYQEANPGEYTIVDNSLGAASGTFSSGNLSGNVTLSPGASQSITFTSNGPQTYTYIAVDSAGTCSDTLTGTIYVGNISCPSFAGVIVSSGAAPGEFIITDNSTAGTSSYFYHGTSWNGFFILPNPSTTYTYSANGLYNYTYVVFDSLTYCTDSIFGTVTVTGITPPQNCSASFILLQDSLNLSQYYCWNTAVNSTGGTAGLSYFWNFGDGSTSTSAYPTHTYGTLGTFPICLSITDSINGCTSMYCDSVMVTVKASGTTINVLPAGANIGLEEQHAFSKVTLFPNPSNGDFTLQIESTTQRTININIVNITGQVLFASEEVIFEGSNSIEIHPDGLSNGVYLVTVKDQISGSVEILRILVN